MLFIRLFRVILLFLLVFTPAAHAASSPWEFAGWYGGGCFPNVEFDPNVKGRVYLTSDVAGIWRSDDSGDHWQFITKGLEHLIVAQVAVAPSDSNVLYAATGGGLFVSKNAGASWSRADSMQNKITFVRPANYRSIVVDALEPNRLCVGTAQGRIFCSQDFGASWRDMDPAKMFTDTKPMTALAFDSTGKFVYVASSKGLNRCAFDGSGCAALSQGPDKVTDFVFSKKFPQTIYSAGETALWISRDAGATWKQSKPVPQGNTFRVAVDESGQYPVIRVIWNKDWNGGALVTKDEGALWEGQDRNLKSDMVFAPAHAWVKNGGRSTAIKIDPFNPNVVFRADFFGVWRSDDGGTNWNEKIIGAPNTVATDLAFLPNGDLIVASMDNGLLRSSDAGKHYQMLFPLKYDDFQSGHVWRATAAGSSIIATSSPWNKIINQVIVSRDGGKTFEMVRSGLPEGRPKKNTMWGEGYPRALAVDPKDPNILYLGIDGDDGGGLFVSKDRGLTWLRSAGQPGSVRVYNGLAVDPTNSQRIVWGAAGQNGGVYISNDGGKTFLYSFKQMTWVTDVAVGSNGVIYAAGDSGGAKLYSSVDHGVNWKMIGDFQKNRALAEVSVDPKNPLRIAVSTVSWGSGAPCKIFLTVDGGKNWTDVTGDLPEGSGASAIAFDPQGKYLYITRYAGSVYRLLLN